MVSKRSFHGEESDVVACKHPRQEEHTAQQSLVGQISPCDNAQLKPFSDDEGETSFSKAEEEKEIRSDSIHPDPNWANKEFGVSASRNISSYLWANDNAIDEYMESDESICLSVFPNYLELDRRVWTLVQSDDVYSTLLENSSRKMVSVGPDHQADVLEWVPQGSRNCSDYLNKSEEIDHQKKLMGTCVIPTADLESREYYSCIGGEVGSKCECPDRGSIRCVRQHVMEARDELREILGPITFEELGFSDMGEEVSKKWSGEDEQAFHEVVLSNPASEGKNFWGHLSSVFPSRKKRDLVSYYFNVFMLRKRAEQNRFNTLNIDSDDDEWQRIEPGMPEDDDDSVVESLVDQDGPFYYPENHEEDCLEGIEEDVEDEGDMGNDSEAHTVSFVSDCGFDPFLQFSGKKSSDNGEDHDFQDDSCTSYEFQNDRVDSCGPVDLTTDGRVVFKSGHDK